MALTDAQRRAQESYRKRPVKQVAVRFYPAEEELWAWLGAQDNKAGYIKGLIRADMEARREGRPASLITSQIDTAPKPEVTGPRPCEV